MSTQVRNFQGLELAPHSCDKIDGKAWSAQDVKETLERIYDARQCLLGYANSILRSQDAADDYLQEYYQKLTQRKTWELYDKKYMTPSKLFWAWFRIWLLEFRRKTRKREATLGEADLVGISSPHLGPHELNEQTDWRDILSKALEQAIVHLTPEQRDALQRRYFEAQSIETIARDLGCKEEAVHGRLHRARTQLARNPSLQRLIELGFGRPRSDVDTTRCTCLVPCQCKPKNRMEGRS